MFKKTCWTLAIAYLLVFSTSFAFAQHHKKKKYYKTDGSPPLSASAICQTTCTKAGIFYLYGDVQGYTYLNCVIPPGCTNCHRCLYRITFLVEVLQNDGTWEVIENYCGEGQLICGSSNNLIPVPTVHVGVNEFNAILNVYDYVCGSCSNPVVLCKPIGGDVLVGP